MKIAHVTATFPPYYSGTGMVCHYSALHLGRLGHEVTVFTAKHPPGEYEYPQEYAVERLPVVFRFGNAPFSPGLLKIRDFDIIHLHHPFIFGTEFIGAVSRLRNIPLVMTHHNDLIGDGLRPYIFDSYSAVSKRLLFAQASKLLVVSRDHAQSSLLKEEFSRRWDDVVEMPNGVDTDLFSPGAGGRQLRRKLGIPASSAMLLFVGVLDRAHHFKGVARLLNAFAIIDSQDAVLVIVGDGDLRQGYEQLALDLGIGESVRFVGAKSNDETPQYYQAADMCVLPTMPPESFGIVLIEAMACGTPVIASNLPGVRTVIDDGVDGFLVRAGDISDLARKLDIMLQISPESRQEMGMAGRRKVEARYSWERIASSLEQCYFEILAEQRRGERSPAQKEQAAAET